MIESPKLLRCLGDAGGREWSTCRRHVPWTGCSMQNLSLVCQCLALCSGFCSLSCPACPIPRFRELSDTGCGLDCTLHQRIAAKRVLHCCTAGLSSCSHGGRAATTTNEKTSQETAARDGTRRPRHALLFASHRSLRSRWLRGLRAPALPARRARPAAAAGPAARELS